MVRPATTAGAWLERGDVVVVTVNHRLGYLGFLYLADLGGDAYADSGNVGTLDMVASLQWVHDNVESFGGDPDNVTVFGESGGGFKVSTLLATPAAAGLFHRAVIKAAPTSGRSSRRRHRGGREDDGRALGRLARRAGSRSPPDSPVAAQVVLPEAPSVAEVPRSDRSWTGGP